MARRRQAVTIKHVAADAGVSLQTVSRVVNKDAGVRPEMVARVQEAIDRLGYVPSIAAQRMGGSRSYLIVALNDRERTLADWRARQGTDWVDQMLLGSMLTCATYGYRMIVELVDTHSDHIVRELMGAIAALQPDGVILTPPHSDNALIVDLLEAQRISFVRIGSRRAGPGFALTMDEERASRISTEHLVALGHTRIGFIAGPLEYELSQWRVDGWRTGMSAAGLTDDLLARGDFGYASGRDAAAMLLDAPDPATAIIASNDQMALATLELCRERGLSVPHDVSLISFDNTPIVRFTHPPLSAIDQPIADLAARAVELIIGELAGRDAPDQSIIIPAKLDLRQSTALRRSCRTSR